VFEINGNKAKLRASPNSTGLYVYDQLPASADYDVEAVIRTGSTGTAFGVVGRASKTVSTFYMARWSAGFLQLYKFVAGTATEIGTGVAQTITTNTDYTLKLSMSGSTIKLFLNGVQKISTTDTAIPANGYPGIRTNATTASVQYDSFSVTNMGGGSGASTGSPSSTSLIAPSASATGTTVINGAASGLAAAMALVVPAASASASSPGSASGSGSPSVMTTTVPAASGSGTTVINGTGSGSPVASGLNSPAASATGTTTSVGTFVTPVLKNNTGTVLANETGVIVNVYDQTSGVLVLHKTGQTSNASGIVTVADAVLTPGTTYAYEVVLTSARRLPVAAPV